MIESMTVRAPLLTSLLLVLLHAMPSQAQEAMEKACTCGRGMAGMMILGGALLVAAIAALISLSIFLIRRSRAH